MWPATFEQRLHAWGVLRETVQHAPLEQVLAEVNTWWFQTPWRAYHLHWDDRPKWPDPWELLSDNIYCDLARGLGILYTITLLDRADLQDSALVESDQGNLVLVEQGKYILNWDSQQVLNINPGQIKAQHSITQEQIQQQIR
jgi:hypothetical protein